MPGMCRFFIPVNTRSHYFKLDINCILTFDYFYGPCLICKCTCTFTRMSSSPSLIFQFHQNSSQLLFHIMVSLRGAGAFSRDFTTNLAPQCQAFSGALKIEKLKAPLFPGLRGPGIQMTCALAAVFYLQESFDVLSKFNFRLSKPF